MSSNPETPHIPIGSEFEVLRLRLQAAKDFTTLYAALDEMTAYLTAHHHQQQAKAADGEQ